MGPSTATYVFSYHYVCVLILLYMCPHTSMYVPSFYICVLIQATPRRNTEDEIYSLIEEIGGTEGASQVGAPVFVLLH